MAGQEFSAGGLEGGANGVDPGCHLGSLDADPYPDLGGRVMEPESV
jgi:hypothetical protein